MTTKHVLAAILVRGLCAAVALAAILIVVPLLGLPEFVALIASVTAALAYARFQEDVIDRLFPRFSAPVGHSKGETQPSGR